MRRDFGKDDLPFVQVQIGSHSLYGIEQGAKEWTAIAKQRTLGGRYRNLGTVTAVDCPATI
ncbi:MAG: hypothetical protein ACLR5G_07340 [Eubacteriales bacterium]